MCISPLCYILSYVGHVDWLLGSSDTSFKLETLMMIVIKFGENDLSSFIEDFEKLQQLKKKY